MIIRCCPDVISCITPSHLCPTMPAFPHTQLYPSFITTSEHWRTNLDCSCRTEQSHLQQAICKGLVRVFVVHNVHNRAQWYTAIGGSKWLNSCSLQTALVAYVSALLIEISCTRCIINTDLTRLLYRLPSQAPLKLNSRFNTVPKIINVITAEIDS